MEKKEQFEYDVTLQVRDGKYFLQIKELSIFAENMDLNVAYQDLISEKENVISEYSYHGILDSIPKPLSSFTNANNHKVDNGQNYKPFILKSVIVSLLFLISLSFAGGFISNNLEEVVLKLDKIRHIKLGREIEHEILKAAAKETSPERRERLIKGIRKIVSDYKPVANEVLLLFKDDRKN